VEAEPGHIIAAWFGGTDEGEPDVGIWVAHRKGGNWSDPLEAARHERVPCWNPVLWKDRISGEIWLFYKAGPSPTTWSGFLKRSTDGGKTWSEEELLPAGILGPIKNKPLQLEDGTLLCGSSVESWKAWGCWCEITRDGGRTWSKGSPINLKENFEGVIQPTIFRAGPGLLRMLMRTNDPIGKIAMSVSEDEGRSWSDATLIDLPNPDSGFDAVNLKDGRVVLLYNPTVRVPGDDMRSPLSVAISSDGGQSWKRIVDLENTPGGEFSYPAVIQTSDGKVAMTYTWNREKIRFALLEP
jgi:predicted neuraminidase